MASDNLDKDDILGGLSDELVKLIGIIGDGKKELESLIISQKKLAESFRGGSSKEIKELYKNLDILNKTIEKHKFLTNEELKAKVKLTKIESERLKQQKLNEAAEIVSEKLKQQKLKTFDKEIASEKKLEDAIRKKAEQQKKDIAQAAKVIDQMNKANSIYSIQSKKLNDLRKEYKDLATKQALTNDLTDKETKRLGELTKQITSLDTILKKVDADTGQFQRSVGDYKNAVKDALKETDLFSGAINNLGESNNAVISGLNKVVDSLKAQQEAAKQAGKQTSKLGTFFKGLGLTAVVLLLGSIKDGFSATSEGAKKLESATAQASSGTQVFFERTRKAISSFQTFNNAFLLGGLFSEAGHAALKIAAKELADSYKGMGEQIKEAAKAADNLIEQSFKLSATLRRLRLEQQQFNLDLADEQEISNDVTRGIAQRDAALKKSFILERQAAEKGVEIANKELELSNEKIRLKLVEQSVIKNTTDITDEELSKLNDDNEKSAALRLKLNNELLDSQEEALKKQRDAADALSDLDRQQLMKSREVLERKLGLEIELLRSKKNSTQLLSEELQKQIDDEKNTLDERQIFASQQLANEQAITDKIISKIQRIAIEEAKSAGVKIPLIEKETLLRQGNALLLEEQIKNLGLSEGLTKELAGVIKKAQEAELKSSENLNKIEEDRIKLKQKLIELEAERQSIVEQSVIDDLQNQSQLSIDEQQKLQTKLLEGENALNENIISRRRELHEQTLLLLRAEFEERERLLKLQLDSEVRNIDNSVASEEEKDARKLNAQTKYINDYEKLERDKTKAVSEENKRETDNLEAQKKAQIKIITDFANSTLDQIDTQIQAENDKKQAQFDAQIDQTQRNISRQEELAQQGLANNLAFQEEQLAKEQLAKADAEKAAQRALKITALLKAYAAYVAQDPNTAISKSLRDIATLKIAELATVGFYEGTEKVKDSLEGNPNIKDGYPIRVDGEERIFKGSQNKKFGKISNDKVTDLVSDYQNGNLINWVGSTELNGLLLKSNFSENLFGQNMSSQIKLQDFTPVIKRLESIEKAISEKPVPNFEFTELEGFIKSEIRNGITRREISNSKRKFQ